MVAPDLHWILDEQGARHGDGDPPHRGDAVGAALTSVRAAETFAASIEPNVFGLLGHSMGGAVVWNYARSGAEAASAVGVMTPNAALMEPRGVDSSPDRGGRDYPVLFVTGDNDFLLFSTDHRYPLINGPKVRVDIQGSEHWCYTDSIVGQDRPAVLSVAGATLPEEELAQRLLGTHFVTVFFRAHLLGDQAVSEDLELNDVLDRVPGTHVGVNVG